MRRLLRDRSANAAVSWAGIVAVFVGTAYGAAAGAVAWALFGAGLASTLLVPAVAYRSPRVTPSWPVTLLAAGAFAAAALLPDGWPAELAAYAAVAAVALVVVVEFDAFTPVRTNRGFAVALVVMTTTTAAGVWELALWVYDFGAGTAMVPDNETLMWRLVAATGAGVVAGVVFDRYLRHLVRQEFVPDGFEAEDAGAQVDSVGDAVTDSLERAGLSTARQRQLTRGAQALLAVIAVVGVVTLSLNVVVNASIGIAATLLPAFLEREYDVDLDTGLVLWIAVAVTFHAMGTLLLYQTLRGRHNVAHVVTGTLVAAIGYTAVRTLEVHARAVSFPPKFTFVVVVLFAFSAGACWEIVEFALDGLAVAVGTEDHVLAQHGLDDTMLDLVADTVGGVVVAGAATVYRYRG